MEYNYFDTSKEQQETWEALCPVNKYRVITPDEIPSTILPPELLKKCDSVFVMSSGNDAGITYILANLNRVDIPPKEIDQMPFGIAFSGNEALPSGCIVQHANYPGRTTSPPKDFWNYIAASGIGNKYPLAELPEQSSGSITDLAINSQQEAFTIIVDKLKEFTNE